jgi:glutamine---fructose-6-phosphate transaminase (isomerizing)
MPKVFNLYGDHWDREEDRPGWRSKDAWVGHRIGAELLGGSLYELEPGDRLYPYHTHRSGLRAGVNGDRAGVTGPASPGRRRHRRPGQHSRHHPARRQAPLRRPGRVLRRVIVSEIAPGATFLVAPGAGRTQCVPMTALSETIAAQGDLLESVLSVPVDDAAERIGRSERLWLVGTGTSQHAAELGALMFGPGKRDARWRSSAAFCSDAPALTADDAVVIISHTTETAFARRARAHAIESGAGVVSITAQGRGWPEAIEAAPLERAQTYTASYLAALVVLARLSVAVGEPGFDERQLAELPGRVRMAAHAPAVLEGPPARLLVLAGAGPAAVTAREGALKLREGAQLPAEGYEAEYLLHGTAVPLGPGDAFVALQPSDDRFGLLELLVAAAASEGLEARTVSEADGLHPVLAQIPLTVRLQRLASDLADARGIDPDRVIRGGWAEDRLWQAGAP